MSWRFQNIPKEKGEELVQLYTEGEYFKIFDLFIEWKVIPGGCRSCLGYVSQIPGYIEYAINKNKIPGYHERQEAKTDSRAQDPTSDGS